MILLLYLAALKRFSSSSSKRGHLGGIDLGIAPSQTRFRSTCHRLWACIVAFGDALSQEDPQDPQDPLNLPEDTLAFFGLNPLNIYERASSCSLDFFSFFPSLSLRYSLIKDRQLQQNCLRLSHYPPVIDGSWVGNLKVCCCFCNGWTPKTILFRIF
jgi:hypothetical protein